MIWWMGFGMGSGWWWPSSLCWAHGRYTEISCEMAKRCSPLSLERGTERRPCGASASSWFFSSPIQSSLSWSSVRRPPVKLKDARWVTQYSGDKSDSIVFTVLYEVFGVANRFDSGTSWISSLSKGKKIWSSRIWIDQIIINWRRGSWEMDQIFIFTIVHSIPRAWTDREFSRCFPFDLIFTLCTASRVVAHFVSILVFTIVHSNPPALTDREWRMMIYFQHKEFWL